MVREQGYWTQSQSSPEQSQLRVVVPRNGGIGSSRLHFRGTSTLTVMNASFDEAFGSPHSVRQSVPRHGLCHRGHPDTGCVTGDTACATKAEDNMTVGNARLWVCQKCECMILSEQYNGIQNTFV